MIDRDVRVFNCPRNVTVVPLEKGKIFGKVIRDCSKTNESPNFLMIDRAAFCLEDCPEKKLVDKKLPIIGCPYEGVKFPIKVTKGESKVGEERFFCYQPYNFVDIAYYSTSAGNDLAACGNSANCKSSVGKDMSLGYFRSKKNY